MVPVLVLLFFALWVILRGDLFYVLPCVILFLCFSVFLALRLPRLGKRELILVLFVRLFDLSCLVLSVSSSSWCLGRAAVCDCGTPWNFLLPFLSLCFCSSSFLFFFWCMEGCDFGSPGYLHLYVCYFSCQRKYPFYYCRLSFLQQTTLSDGSHINKSNQVEFDLLVYVKTGTWSISASLQSDKSLCCLLVYSLVPEIIFRHDKDSHQKLCICPGDPRYCSR